MEGSPHCIPQPGNVNKGILYFSPPGEEVLENHRWLKFTIRKPLIEDLPDTDQKQTRHMPETDGNEVKDKSEVRIRIWPNPKPKDGKGPENCETHDHEQELFGKMNQISTFVLSTKEYGGYGVCMQVEIEDEHRRWKKVKRTDCDTYDVVFEGNGEDRERSVAVAFALLTYIVFSLAFLQLWFCLLKTGRFM